MPRNYGPYSSFEEAKVALGDLAYTYYGGGGDVPAPDEFNSGYSNVAWGGNPETTVTGEQNLYDQPAADEFYSGLSPRPMRDEETAGYYDIPAGEGNYPSGGGGNNLFPQSGQGSQTSRVNTGGLFPTSGGGQFGGMVIPSKTGTGGTNGLKDLTSTSFTTPFPEMMSADKFAAPGRNTARINELAGQKSAAGLRAMRSQIQKAMGQTYRNPNVKRMTLRDALAGYGQGIENVMTGAQTAASNEYEKEYGTSVNEAATNWQADYNIKMKDWENKVKGWFNEYNRATGGKNTITLATQP